MRVGGVLLVPPEKDILDLLWVIVEVAIKFILKL